MGIDFVHLHNHTEYSLLDGLSKIKLLVAKVKELGMKSVAITDHGVMYGAVEFYKGCTKEGVKPIIGLEGYIVPEDLRRKSDKRDRVNYHLTLLAKNHQGYRNLMQLSSIANVEGFYYRPRFDRKTLANHSTGLICLSGCSNGEIAQSLIAGNFSLAAEAADFYRRLFGDDFYLEIQRHRPADYLSEAVNDRIRESLRKMQTEEDAVNTGLVRLSREKGIPLAATNDTHYVEKSDAVAQDALVCISTARNVADIDRMRYVDTPTFYLRSPDEMASLFADLPDSLANTNRIADSTGLEIEMGKWHFPNFDLPPGKDAPGLLREMCYERLPQRYSLQTSEITDRIEFELEVIISKGYAPYFLILADMVNFCFSHGIITNTRGSAAGSVVSYIMGITTVDPLKYYLPFERFLNPYRPSPPDIDLDIADDRREELITYVTEKYGHDKVAQICTFGRMMARASVRDVARVLGHPYAFGDRVAKVIPMGSQGFPMTINRALDESPQLHAMYDSEPQIKETVDLAHRIEGNARHASVHAAGIVVSPLVMTEFTPLQLEPKGTKVITQYEMHACEDVGLVKFDILGIRNLSILGAARDIVEKQRQIKINLDRIPLDDKKTFSMLSRGETMGVFQLGGSGMTKWLKELKPNRIEDIMAMIALFRPGPMANIPEYLARKNHRSEITYMHPKMSKFLEKSYGILVYQDDLLFTALELAGYTWESVDKFRKAVGKKIPEEMAKQHDIFVKGCQTHSGMSEADAEKIWELFVPFQGYGFNKAHAASYGIVSYQTAYMKAHYPVEYMTALLTAESGNTDKVVEAIEECRRMKILVLPPDINLSHTIFTMENSSQSLENLAIRFGLSAIKNVGEAAIEAILKARSEGSFASFTDFCFKVDAQKVNRKVLESLIKSGALDNFGCRAAMLAVLDKIRETGNSLNRIKSLGQTSLFGADAGPDTSDHFPQVEEFERTAKLEMEKEMLGFFLTGHPYAEALGQMRKIAPHTVSDLYSADMNNQTILLGGIIDQVRLVTTKNNNQQMCFVKISDTSRSVEAVVFPRVYAATASVWKADNPVLIRGRLEAKELAADEDNPEAVGLEVSLLVETAAVFIGPDTQLPVINGNHHKPDTAPGLPAQSGKSTSAQPVSVYIPAGISQSRLVALNSLLRSHPGRQPVVLVFTKSSSVKSVPVPYGLDWTDQLASRVSALLKGESVG